MGALLKNNILDMVSNIVSPVNQQTTQPTGITSLPVTTQPVDQVLSPTSPIRGFNQVRDPRLNRIVARPMFRTSRYDSRINDLLGRLLPDSAPNTPQLLMRPTTDPMGRSYSDPRYYKMGGRVNYEDGGSSKTPPKFIPMDLESVAFRLFRDNLDNLTYNQKQTVYDYIEANRNKKADGGNINLPSMPAKVRSIGLLFNPDGSYPGDNMPNPIQALPRADTRIQIQSPSQTESIKETLMSLPLTRSNPLINVMKKINQIRDPRIARLLQQRQNRARGGIMNLKVGGLPAEMDFRATGGFVPIGKKERADDVPARLSKNEFVFTANAVRNAGGGDIRKGAKRMYNLMHQLEAKR